MRTAFTHLYMKGIKIQFRQPVQHSPSAGRAAIAHVVVQARHGHPHCYIEYGYFCTVGTVFTRL